MSTLNYITEASTEQYSESAFNYILDFQAEIKATANILGVSEGAIAGAMAEAR